MTNRGTFSEQADELASSIAQVVREVCRGVSGVPNREEIQTAVDRLGSAFEFAMAAMVIGAGIPAEVDESRKLFLIKYEVTSVTDNGIHAVNSEIIVEGETKDSVCEKFNSEQRNSMTQKTRIIHCEEWVGQRNEAREGV